MSSIISRVHIHDDSIGFKQAKKVEMSLIAIEIIEIIRLGY